ncbi:hypothetical protein [Aurantiacibacter aquimixticola]|uniref:Uncharacterized protein n=1 Tax=Aurantiacibacter aquimixticola TaxID=1958945 RepID=A0A419RVZ4_9SPHN|nr:hypothetical protein [Aurantiacibacter aquimixticola]RJY09965.1 hypothetical protein D6201_11950 [Aurantiacibacter aquimixticola]
MPKANHLTDRIADAMNDDSAETMPGPSPNPATNLLIYNILLRGVGRLSRQTVEKALLGRKYGKDFAKDAVENRSLLHAVAAYGVTKYATKSVPGFLLVSTGLLAKTLFDRSQGRRAAIRSGQKTLEKQADPDSAI